MIMYRIVPGWLSRFELQRRYLWFFWDSITTSDDFEKLEETVKRTGGKLIGH